MSIDNEDISIFSFELDPKVGDIICNWLDLNLFI